MNKFFRRIFEIEKIKYHVIVKVFGVKIKLKYVYFVKSTFKMYAAKETFLRKKEKINVAFTVFSASMFPAKPFADFLLKEKSDNYNVKILILPDFRFDNEKTAEIQEKCYSELMQIYSPETLIKVPLEAEDDTIDFNSVTDIVFPALPYDISHPKYDLLNIIKAGILPAMVNYGFYRSYYDRKLIAQQEYSFYWKIFVETQYNLDEYKKFQYVKGDNCELVGYCKMDDFIKYENAAKTDKKVIIIAPHHSVEGGFNDILGLSNFHKYADFFLKLPELYPNINFIFRPHPVLFPVLAKKQFWGQQRVNEYLAQMKKYPNVTFSDGGNYFEIFAKSDGIIQDCGSYLVEYFYTGKPQCYMLKSPSDIVEKFTHLGQKCLENSYIAYDEQHIIDYIEKVIIDGNDTKKEKREAFAENDVKLNYPNVSAKMAEIFDEIFFPEKQKKEI